MECNIYMCIILRHIYYRSIAFIVYLFTGISVIPGKYTNPLHILETCLQDSTMNVKCSVQIKLTVGHFLINISSAICISKNAVMKRVNFLLEKFLKT